MAALLACGQGSALAYGSAASAWNLRAAPILPVEVVVAGARGREQRRIKAHRMSLHPMDTMTLDGLRITTPARTIVDLAATLSPRALRETVERAQDLRRFHPNEIRATLARNPGRPGTRPLRDLMTLMEPDEDGARSHLERLFLLVVRKHRLPRPDVNHPIARRKRDFVWPEQRLVVEVDGYEYHSTREAKRRDHQRDRELTGLRWRPARFTYEDVAFEPGEVATELAGLLI
ncbi:MAG: hypothetical protein JWN32_1541 [Solirubrobacterales bacterium]|nr:hypothetical protein [Solirubrobacterales bacterium]